MDITEPDRHIFKQREAKKGALFELAEALGVVGEAADQFARHNDLFSDFAADSQADPTLYVVGSRARDHGKLSDRERSHCDHRIEFTFTHPPIKTFFAMYVSPVFACDQRASYLCDRLRTARKVAPTDMSKPSATGWGAFDPCRPLEFDRV